MWRKFEPKSTFVEKKLQIWGLVVQIHNQTVLFILRRDALYQVVLHLFQINVLCHNSFGGCCNLVLSWSCGRRRNKRTFHHLHYLQDHHNCFKIWVIGCGLLPFRPIAIIAFSWFLSKVRHQMSPQMHCLQQFKAKVVSIMQIFYRLCLQM